MYLDEQQSLDKALEAQLVKAANYEKWPLGQLISVFENTQEKAQQHRHDIVSHLERNKSSFPKLATVCGFTGAPGAGKSTLLGELALTLLKQDKTLSIAILAVDPSSHISGGSFLGDRTRVSIPYGEKRLFFRSQASNLEFGGVSQNTYQVVRLLRHLFDFIFIETVGIGQSEIDIQQLSHHTCLVMQPLAGDQVQFMKAGIMEIPDTYIVNKCDENILAQRSLNLLKTSLRQAQIVEEGVAEKTPIFLTSAIKKIGLVELGIHLLAIAEKNKSSGGTDPSFEKSETFFFHRWVMLGFGQFGLEFLNQMTLQTPNVNPDLTVDIRAGASEDRVPMTTFEQRKRAFLDAISEHITKALGESHFFERL
ncbi:MAG: hypothetical protein KUG82_01820 [Pseudomonadales bacterium]|nr:hypothetical protein [Pseudomonadales bacterium]